MHDGNLSRLVSSVFIPGPEPIRGGAVLLPNELEEESVEDEDEEADAEPEDGR